MFVKTLNLLVVPENHVFKTIYLKSYFPLYSLHINNNSFVTANKKNNIRLESTGR
jgi:hypothetical protein